MTTGSGDDKPRLMPRRRIIPDGPQIWPQIWLSGALTPPLAGLVAVAGTARFWPDGDGVGTLGRMLDSVAPQLFVLALPGLVVLAALGARRMAAVLGLGWAVGAAALAALHLGQAGAPLPPDRAQLQVLWFNMQGGNPTPPDRLVQALTDSGADLVLLAEARALHGHAAMATGALAAHFPYRAGCAAAARCDLMVLSRRPLAAVRIDPPGRLDEDRLARVDLDLPGGRLTVIAAHLVKPWTGGVADSEEAGLHRALRATDGPVLLAGDFNAAPWGRRMQRLITRHGLAPARHPPATWPVPAGALGVPIDQALGRGVAITRPAPWGADLGSNHRGIRFGLRLDGSLPNDHPPA